MRIQPISFGHHSDINDVDRFANREAGNQHLAFYTVPPEGRRRFNWLFFHRPGIKAAVHSLPIIKNDKGEYVIHLLMMKRPPMGGRITIELPGGLWGDQDTEENALQAASRELKEETNLDVRHTQMLNDNLFATSAGMTTEMKTFALTYAHGEPRGDNREPDEQDMIIGELNVPLDTFTHHRKFTAWLNRMHREGYIVGMAVLAARGLMPPRLGSKLDQMG